MAKYLTEVDVMVANQLALMYADDEVCQNISDTGLYNQTSYEYNTTVKYDEI